MSSEHPSDVELFEYVEGELAGDEAARVRQHVEACPVCSEAIAASTQGRDVLRASPLLTAPAGARPEPSLLGRQDAADHAPRRWSAARLLAILAPAAAVVAAVVTVVVVTHGNGGGTSGTEAAPEAAAAGAATTAAATTVRAAGGSADTGAAVGGPSATESAARPVARVEGTPGEVASFLRSEGLDARAAGDNVQVSGATPKQVRTALAGRPKGLVRVFVVP